MGESNDSILLEKTFIAAVSVVQGIQSNESYEPSKQIMSTFCVLHKQATIGDCRSEWKPAFWRFEEMAEYHAWLALVGVDKKTAMQCYISQLNKIIETMSLTTEVANYLNVVNANHSELGMGDDILVFSKHENRIESDIASHQVSHTHTPEFSPAIQDDFRIKIEDGADITNPADGRYSNSDNVSEFFYSVASGCNSTYYSDCDASSSDEQNVFPDCDDPVSEERLNENDDNNNRSERTPPTGDVMTENRLNSIEITLAAIKKRLAEVEGRGFEVTSNSVSDGSPALSCEVNQSVPSSCAKENSYQMIRTTCKTVLACAAATLLVITLVKVLRPRVR